MVPLTFVGGLDGMVTSVGWRVIGDSLGGFEQQAWVTTAFLAGGAATIPFWGRLADTRGRPQLLAAALILFAVGTAGCGMARSMLELAAWRALQGAGGAAAWPVAQAFVHVAIPPKDRGRYVGFFTAAYVAGVAVAPLGGLIASAGQIAGVAGWRWLFFVQVPVIVANLAAVWAARRLPDQRTAARIDMRGGALLVLGVGALALAPQFARDLSGANPTVLVCMGVAFGAFGAFYLSARSAGPRSVLPLAMLRGPQFRRGLPALMLGYFATAGVAYVLPLYWQISRGASPALAGWLIWPQILGTLAGSFAESVFMSRTGRYKLQSAVGFGLMTVGIAAVAPLGYTAPWPLAGLAVFLYGLGVGLAFAPLEVALQRSVPPAEYATASGATALVKSMVLTVGASVQLAVLFAAAQARIAAQMRIDGTALPPGAVFDLGHTAGLAELPGPVRQSIETGFATAVGLDLAGCCLAALLALAAVLRVPEERFEAGTRRRARRTAR
ncbi:MAG: MFS transporter [Bifidobacteriaceae bacterium]|jgi:MFS family permease|nr:MFS transporter [Bifidobacteriaceae bacterium]